jgi:hypothetical protein
MANFRQVKINISRASGYGQYYLTAKYKGKEIKVNTTNSECFDWLNDDSDKKKHKEAKEHAYRTIVNAYENL